MQKQKRIFTNEEIEYILSHYQTQSYEKIATHLGNCNKEHVRYQIRKRNLENQKVGMGQPWTKEDDEFLSENWGEKSDGWIGEQLNRTPTSVLKRRLRLGYHRPDGVRLAHKPPKDSWTQEELAFLIENYNVMDIDDLSSKLHRSEKAIQVKATKLKLIHTGTSWSEKEEQFLKDNYQFHSNSHIASILNRSEKSVLHKKRELGLTRGITTSSDEIEIGRLLWDMNKICIPQVKIGPYYFDYYVGKNQLIEYNGDYWHCNPDIYPTGPLHDAQVVRMELDKQKKKYAEQHGYTVLYLWENDFKNNPDKVKNLLGRL